jgi:hypothetical protein
MTISMGATIEGLNSLHPESLHRTRFWTLQLVHGGQRMRPPIRFAI